MSKKPPVVLTIHERVAWNEFTLQRRVSEQEAQRLQRVNGMDPRRWGFYGYRVTGQLTQWRCNREQ